MARTLLQELKGRMSYQTTLMRRLISALVVSTGVIPPIIFKGSLCLNVPYSMLKGHHDTVLYIK